MKKNLSFYGPALSLALVLLCSYAPARASTESAPEMTYSTRIVPDPQSGGLKAAQAVFTVSEKTKGNLAQFFRDLNLPVLEKGQKKVKSIVLPNDQFSIQCEMNQAESTTCVFNLKAGTDVTAFAPGFSLSSIWIFSGVNADITLSSAGISNFDDLLPRLISDDKNGETYRINLSEKVMISSVRVGNIVTFGWVSDK